MKKQLIASLLLLCSAFLYAQTPSNDAFEKAQKIAMLPNEDCVIISGSTLYATESANLKDGFNDVWYTFIAEQDNVIISIENTFFYKKEDNNAIFVELYTKENYQNGKFSFNYNPYYYPSVFNQLVIGKQYYVRIKTQKSANFDLCLSSTTYKATNSDCSKAQLLAVNPTPVADSVQYGICPIAGMPDSNAIWYKFKATSQQHKINLEPWYLSFKVFKGSSCNEVVKIFTVLNDFRFRTEIDSFYYVAIYQVLPPFSQQKFNISITTPLSPANDYCENPTHLTPTKDTAFMPKTKGKMNGAISNEQYEDDVWYDFVATQNFHYLYFKPFFKQNNNTFSFNIFVFDENQNCKTDNPLTAFGSSYDSIFYIKDLTIGKKYLIRVQRYLFDPLTINQNSDFHIAIGEPPIIVANDECKGAINIPIGQGDSCQYLKVVNSVWASASANAEENCGINFGKTLKDLWYQFTPNTATMVFNSEGNFKNIALLKPLNDSCTKFENLKCIEPYGGKKILGNLTPKQVYFLKVDNASDNVEFCLKETVPSPLNDKRENATALIINALDSCSLPITGTLLSASIETNKPYSCNTEHLPDVWYRFKATHNAHRVQLKLIKKLEQYEIKYEIYQLNANQLSQVVCDDIYLKNNTFYTEKDSIYYIRIVAENGVFYKENIFEICVSAPLEFTKSTNDKLCDASNIEMNESGNLFSSKQYSTKGATKTAVFPKFFCKNTNNALDIWFKFKATANEVLLLRSNAQNQDSVAIQDVDLTYELYELLPQRCDTLLNKTCIANLKETNLLQNLSEGKSYIIRVMNYSLSPYKYINFGLHIDTFPKGNPKNDFCKNATVLPMNIGFKAIVATKGKFYKATSDKISANLVQSCASADPENVDIWYQFAATQAIHAVQHKQLSQNNFVIVTEVFTGDCSNLELVECEEIYTGQILMNNLKAGKTYYVRVHCNLPPLNAAKALNEFEIAVIAPTQITRNSCSQAQTITITPYADKRIIYHRETAVSTFWQKFKPKKPIVIMNFLNTYNYKNQQVELQMKSICPGTTDYSSIAINTPLVFQGLDTTKTYYINFSIDKAVAFDFELHYLATPPSNISCEKAREIPVNPDLIANKTINDTFNNRYGMKDMSGRWYEFTATQAVHYLSVSNFKHELKLIRYVMVNNLSNENCKATGGFSAGLSDTTFRLEALTVGQKYRFELLNDYEYDKVYSTYRICLLTPPIHQFDECENAGLIDLALPKNSVNVQHQWASQDKIKIPFCLSDKPTIWYKFKPKKQNYVLRLSNFGSNNYLDCSVFSGFCDNLIPEFCRTVYSQSTKADTFHLIGLDTSAFYYLRLATRNTLIFQFDLEEYNIPITSLVPNDLCQNAKTIQINDFKNIIHKYKANLNYAKGEAPSLWCGNFGCRDVWYKFTTSSEDITIFFNPENKSVTNYHINLYQGDCKNLIGKSWNSYLFQNLEENTTYYLQIEDAKIIGDSKYEFYLMAIEQPKNASCDNPTLIPVSPTTQPDSLIHANNSWVKKSNYSYGCDGAGEVWYKFVATNSKHKIWFKSDIFDKNQKSLYTVGIYQNKCSIEGFFRCIKQPELSANSNMVLVNLQAGATYYLRVGRLYELGEYPDEYFHLGITQIDTAFEAFDCDRALNVPVNDSSIATKFLRIDTKNSPIRSYNNWAEGTVWLQFKATAKRQKLILTNRKLDFEYKITFNYRATASDCSVGSPIYLQYDTPDKVFENLTINKFYYIKLTVQKQFVDNFTTTLPLLDINTVFDAAIITLPNRPVNDKIETAKSLKVGASGVCSDTMIGSTLNALSNTTYLPSVWYKFSGRKGFHIIDIQDLASKSVRNIFQYELFNAQNVNIVESRMQAYQAQPVLLEQGKTYYIRVFNRNTDALDQRFSICVRQVLPYDEYDTTSEILSDNEGKCAKSVTLNTDFASISINPAIPIEECILARPPHDVWFKTLAKQTALTLAFAQKPDNAQPLVSAYRKVGNDYLLTGNLCDEDTLRNLPIGEMIYFRLWSNNNAVGDYEVCVNAHNIIANKDIVNNVFRLFPNPTNDFLTIETPNMSLENAQIKIVDLLGKTVCQTTFSERNSSQNIDIQHLVSGVYFLQITKEEKKWTKKFIKE